MFEVAVLPARMSCLVTAISVAPILAYVVVSI